MGDESKVKLGIGVWITIISALGVGLGQALLLSWAGAIFYTNTNADLKLLKDALPAVQKTAQEARQVAQIGRATESNLDQRLKVVEDAEKKRGKPR